MIDSTLRKPRLQLFSTIVPFIQVRFWKYQSGIPPVSLLQLMASSRFWPVAQIYITNRMRVIVIRCVLLWVLAHSRTPRHLFGALPLHLRGARCLGPKHTGSDADGQVESIHLVVLSVALDTVQHGDNVSQQKEVFTRQEVEQPEREHYYHHTHSSSDAPQNIAYWVTFCAEAITKNSEYKDGSYLWIDCTFCSPASVSIASIHRSYRSTHSRLPGILRRKSYKQN